MSRIIQYLTAIIVFGAAITLWDGFFVLPEGEQVVITQFGRPVGQPIVDAGLHFKKPFVQKTTTFDKKVIIWDGDPNQIPTRDKTFVYLDVTARWKIKDALLFLQAANNEHRAQTLLDDILDGTVRDMINKNDLVEIIRSSDWSPTGMAIQPKVDDTPQVDDTRPQNGRDKIIETVQKNASQALEQYGIELIDVMFKRVNYIETVRRKVYDRMISERKRIAAEKRSLGEGQKAEILGRVQRELKEISSGAEREALLIRGKADAKATKIFADAYSKDPEFYAFLKTLESYEKVVGGNTSLVLSTDSELYRYLNRLK